VTLGHGPRIGEHVARRREKRQLRAHSVHAKSARTSIATNGTPETPW
jgi:hypothetical protein